jgi:MFS family permease
MLVGALFWGMTADIMGRKIAFNVSLLVCSVFAIVAGAAPNWEVLGLFVCLSAFGGGGNLVLDTAVFFGIFAEFATVVSPAILPSGGLLEGVRDLCGIVLRTDSEM